MTARPMVSVCVPAFERPEMLPQLIASFRHQSYPNKELVIADDSRTDAVQRLMSTLDLSSICYHRNAENLGYCRNLRKVLDLASGEYVVILGDDDVLLSPGTLDRYAEVFEEFPEVGFIHCNHVQFSNGLKVDALVRYFPEDRLFGRGEDAMRGIWTKSTFIPGIAIRRNVPLAEWYPTGDLLFPQLELVGNIVNHASAFGIAEFLVGGRAHREQLGFYAIRGERIKGAERHGTLELLSIFEKLAGRYDFSFDDDFLVVDQINRFSWTILKERMIVGRRGVRTNYHSFCRARPRARRSKRLRTSYVIAMVSPTIILRAGRRLALVALGAKNRVERQEEQKQLRQMVTT